MQISRASDARSASVSSFNRAEEKKTLNEVSRVFADSRRDSMRRHLLASRSRFSAATARCDAHRVSFAVADVFSEIHEIKKRKEKKRKRKPLSSRSALTRWRSRRRVVALKLPSRYALVFPIELTNRPRGSVWYTRRRCYALPFPSNSCARFCRSQWKSLAGNARSRSNEIRRRQRRLSSPSPLTYLADINATRRSNYGLYYSATERALEKRVPRN